MEKLFAVLFLSALIGNTLEDDITAIRTEVVSSEGHSVTLSCKYSVKAQNLQWYRQDPGSAVQYLLLITDTKEPEVIEAKPPNPRLTAKLNQERNQVDLQISSAAVSDSAVYYCAVSGGYDKILFGSGTKVSVESNEEDKPSYYKVTGDDGTTACLATDFSRYNATNIVWPITNTSKNQPPVRISGDSVFNQVAIISINDTCESDDVKQEVCTDVLTPDPKVNFVTMTILGLRLLFIKTIVFNVLITLRLWISQ